MLAGNFLQKHSETEQNCRSVTVIEYFVSFWHARGAHVGGHHFCLTHGFM